MKLINTFKAAVMNFVTKTVENVDLIKDELLTLLNENFEKLSMSSQPQLAAVHVRSNLPKQRP